MIKLGVRLSLALAGVGGRVRLACFAKSVAGSLGAVESSLGFSQFNLTLVEKCRCALASLVCRLAS